MPRLQIIIYPQTQEDKEAIEKKAAALGMSVSSYLMFVGLNSNVEIEKKITHEKTKQEVKAEPLKEEPKKQKKTVKQQEFRTFFKDK